MYELEFGHCCVGVFFALSLIMRGSSYIFFYKVKAASKLRCEVCPDKKFTSLKMYDDHMASKKHLKKKRKKETTDAWVCGACDLTLSSQKEWVSTV